MLWARKTIRSSVDTSAQWTSSSSSITGACVERPVEHGQHVLEQAQLRPGVRVVDQPAVSDPAERVDERLVGQLRADEIDRAADEHLEPGDVLLAWPARTPAGTSRSPLPR